VKIISLFSVTTFENGKHLKLSILHMMNFRLIGVEDGDSSGKSVSRWDPAVELARRGDWDHARGKRPSETEIYHKNKKGNYP